MSYLTSELFFFFFFKYPFTSLLKSKNKDFQEDLILNLPKMCADDCGLHDRPLICFTEVRLIAAATGLWSPLNNFFGFQIFRSLSFLEKFLGYFALTLSFT